MKHPNVVKLLIIGQTPPPYVGQMLSIENLVKARFDHISVYHTRMNYSPAIDEIGKVRIRKLFHLLRVIIESGYKIYRHGIDVIYYPPGATTVPLIRDILTLLVLRRFKRKLILVFHASGLSERVRSWGRVPFWFFRKAFFFPDAAIQKSSLNPPDGDFVKAKAVYTVPNGWPDQFHRDHQRRAKNGPPVILFVGLVTEDKGVGVLLEAAGILKERGQSFQVKVVGEFTSREYREQLQRVLDDRGLNDVVEFCGRKVGDEKWALYSEADIFCFPSHYASESFGNVIVEAMMFELPVVSTLWRGIPSIVTEGETGFLVEIKNPQAVADCLERLLDDENLRAEMGGKGRARYLENFTIERYLAETAKVVTEVAAVDRRTPAVIHRREEVPLDVS
jgi:glycosyltransferase involved in cell wall biosynthesis